MIKTQPTSLSPTLACVRKNYANSVSFYQLLSQREQKKNENKISSSWVTNYDVLQHVFHLKGLLFLARLKQKPKTISDREKWFRVRKKSNLKGLHRLPLSLTEILFKSFLKVKVKISFFKFGIRARFMKHRVGDEGNMKSHLRRNETQMA